MTIAERVRPADAESCVRALADADAGRRTLRVRGGGTKDHLGELLPVDGVLETTALSGIVAHVPADLTVTVGAGTPFSALRAALRAHDQFLPLDPPHGDTATVGGIVAANSTMFWRARYGGVRDLLIGTAAALVDGTVVRSGGRVVKNVAGYDLNKLFTGSLGTLGVLVECTFKVLPLPAATSGARARYPRASEAFAAADAVARTSARPAALVVTGTRGGWEVLLQANGDRPAVERTVGLLRGGERDDAIEGALETPREVAGGDHGVVVRASIPIAAQAAFAATAAGLEGFTQIVADAASGIALTRVEGDDDVLCDGADALLAAAHICGGSARVEWRPDALRSRIAFWGGAEPAGAALMRRIKEAFDPHGTLEPGRMPLS